MKKTLLYKSNVGISIYKENLKGICTVKVQVEQPKRNYTLCKYMFPDLTIDYVSDFINWANLNCCGGWAYDKSYLYTAVQNSKKLYAGITVKEIPKEILETLPDDCVYGIEPLEPYGGNNPDIHNYYICKTGTIEDYINISKVFYEYEKFGFPLSKEIILEVKNYCRTDIVNFASYIPYKYYAPINPSQFITTGLLLGYPIESTISVLSEM